MYGSHGGSVIFTSSRSYLILLSCVTASSHALLIPDDRFSSPASPCVRVLFLHSSGFPTVPPLAWRTASWSDSGRARSSAREPNSPSWGRGWPSCAGRWGRTSCPWQRLFSARSNRREGQKYTAVYIQSGPEIQWRFTMSVVKHRTWGEGTSMLVNIITC